MTKSSTGTGKPSKEFTQNLADVLDAERGYLEERRLQNGLPTIEQDGALWGLALSGGGIRSATFNLGVLQALTSAEILKRVDYMSTVSGGGYIGSCLTSLLSNRRDTGVEEANSPFVGLRDSEDYVTPEATELSARHQIHHLRTHGEYLIPRSHLLSRDVQRAVGSTLPGMGHTLLLFLLLFVGCVALLHVTLGAMDPGLQILAPNSRLVIPGADSLGRLEYVKEVVSAWYTRLVVPPFEKVFDGMAGRWQLLIAAIILGGLWSLGWFVVATILARRLDAAPAFPKASTRSGWTAEDQAESNFVRWFNVLSVLLAVGGMLATSLYFTLGEHNEEFLLGLTLPLAFSLGGLAITQFATFFSETLFAWGSWQLGWKSVESRFRRSLYGAIRGACIYGMVAAILLPSLTIVLLSLSVLPLKFFFSLAALAWAYYLMPKGGRPSNLQLGGWIQKPLANLAVFLFLGFAFAEVSAWLLALYRKIGIPSLTGAALAVAGLALVLFLLLGVLIDANRVSPHYFYRDRLTEAYLKTNARTIRSVWTPGLGSESATVAKRQGMPLTVLRDDEDLRLSDLGKGNGRGPYHLIVTALNLQGSNELNRKSFLSDHFLFSRDYIGSRVTGWARTNAYRKNTTRLARAMTISAAAVGSAMGYHAFGAQAFVATLFNMRLGYWMENPWFYQEGARRRSATVPTFWPWYLALEIFGLESARTSLVNLSDGGHTGDNLGLLPLLQRRCSTIVVSDAEADQSYSFESFNNAVRMAFIEENIRIEINLAPIMTRRQSAAGIMVNDASVAVGKIYYPAIPGGDHEREGRLVVLKSSVSGNNIPVHVENYAKGSEPFPHESTADQFFDDAQFEAYRALGQHVGEAAAERMEKSIQATESQRT